MIIRRVGIVLRSLVILALCLTFGCAQQMKSVQSEPVPGVTESAKITGITVSDDASSIEITSDKPIVYTYYMLENPPRVIVDLAQTSPGAQKLPLLVNKGSLKQIDVSKHEFGNSVLSRIDIALSSKTEVSAILDKQEKKRLVISVPLPQSEKVSLVNQDAGTAKIETQQPKSATAEQPVTAPSPLLVVAEPAVVPDKQTLDKVVPLQANTEKQADTAAPTEAVAEPKTVTEKQIAPLAEPVAVNASISGQKEIVAGSGVFLTERNRMQFKPGDRALTAIRKLDGGILLEFSAAPESFKPFKLNKPDRLIIDIPKTKSGVFERIKDVNGFNLSKVRLGGSPEKLRVVFDATGPVPHYSVARNGSNLEISFAEQVPLSSKAENSEPKVAVNELSMPATIAPAVTEAATAPAVAATAAVAPVAEPVSAVVPTPVVAEPKKSAAAAIAAPVEPPAAKTAPAETDARPEITAKPKPAAKTLPGAVDAVEFTQANGVSKVTIRTSGSCVAGEPVKTKTGLSLYLKSCRMPSNLQRQLNTRAFDTAIKSIAPFSVKGGSSPESRVAVNFKGSIPNTLKKDNGNFQWEFKEPISVSKSSRQARAVKAAYVKPETNDFMEKDVAETRTEPVKNKQEKSSDEAFVLEKASQPVLKTGKVYTGRKVTLEFSDADIKKIFQLLAEVSNQNILVSDDVTGTISLKLVNVPWDQALDVILDNKGLGMQRDGNIVQIRPKTKMKSLDDEAVEFRLTEEKKMPLSTVIFDINFATLGDIENQFKNLKSKRNDSSISSDTRTNKIIVVDIDPNINKMRKLLEQLDVPEKQVMIEARIVEASSSFARDMGVKWNFGYTDGSASVANINSLTGSMGGIVSSVLPTSTTGGIAAGMSFGKLISNIQLDLRLSAAASVGQVKIISTPKVLTVNNKPAKISQGQMIPYQNTSSTDGAKTEFIEAALSLEVTPHITSDGSVNMKIKASNNTVGTGGGSTPPINKKEATTELVVKNGETTVIGGIYVDSETESDTGIPYISDMPLLGWLFKSNSKNKVKNEMLIFITPKIMN
ncbi:MAG: type IV pilus secretin PilQ [Geobacteraceae bacterium]|nr:type IV pilus secretin PilQ [Geobacteraceae bacterium]